MLFNLVRKDMYRTLVLFFSMFGVAALKNNNNIKFTRGRLPVIRPPTPPLQHIDMFDTNFLAKNAEPAFVREAELKHGRLAMLAAVIIPVSEMFTDGLGINQFQSLPDNIQDYIVCAMYVFEMASIFRGWENPNIKPFGLKYDYQPGDLGFGMWNPESEEDGDLMDKELNNGRLAMIGVLGMMIQELVTHKQLFA
jgi:light-harvesting complex I chlorophyll a/b binding protein 1